MDEHLRRAGEKIITPAARPLAGIEKDQSQRGMAGKQRTDPRRRYECGPALFVFEYQAALRLLRVKTAVADKMEHMHCSLAQMALAWVLREGRVTSALIGASRPEQIADSVGALAQPGFSAAELAEIDRHAVEGGVNLWAASSERPGPSR